jgi:hypothetical protein
MTILSPDRGVIFKVEDRTYKCRSLHFVVGEAEGPVLATLVLGALKETPVVAR